MDVGFYSQMFGPPCGSIDISLRTSHYYHWIDASRALLPPLSNVLSGRNGLIESLTLFDSFTAYMSFNDNAQVFHPSYKHNMM
jgi:hypothetical protein